MNYIRIYEIFFIFGFYLFIFKLFSFLSVPPRLISLFLLIFIMTYTILYSYFFFFVLLYFCFYFLIYRLRSSSVNFFHSRTWFALWSTMWGILATIGSSSLRCVCRFVKFGHYGISNRF